MLTACCGVIGALLISKSGIHEVIGGPLTLLARFGPSLIPNATVLASRVLAHSDASDKASSHQPSADVHIKKSLMPSSRQERARSHSTDSANTSNSCMKTKSKREIRQTAKSVQAVLAIIVSIAVVLLSIMSSAPAAFTLNKRLFNPALYSRIRAIWFDGVPAGAAVPPMEIAFRWFGRGAPAEKEAFDNACVSATRAALDSIGPDAFPLPALVSNASSAPGGAYAAELAHAAAIAAPFVKELEAAAVAATGVSNDADDRAAGDAARAETALSLLLMLDQMTRNALRKEQGLVYTHYDRISRALLRHVLASSPRADLAPRLRDSPARRLWFYMPLMHSEFLEDHRRYQEIVGGWRDEVEERSGVEDEKLVEWLGMSLQFDKKHSDILERFGRYPHRNAFTGRETTEEEKEYLENGGETFGTG